jgi:MFS family permease
VLALTGGLGSGIAVAVLPLADLGRRAWRLEFALALLGLTLLISVARHLPETFRYLAHHDAPPAPAVVRHERTKVHTFRLVLLAVSALLLAVFIAPAAQFMNEFLRTERHFSAAQISIFTLATNTPGGIGIVVGGWLADVRGRRIVGATAIFAGVGATVLMFLSSGWSMWLWSLVGAVVGTAAIPALSVYGPELFPTNQRGHANGWITATGRVGSVTGLVAAGLLSDHFNRIGPALAILALGPLLLGVLILVAYPETAHQELEDINPEDRLATS